MYTNSVNDPIFRRTLEFYFFPFGKIPKDSKIIIYGAGTVGSEYLHQLRSLQYCSVLFVADKRWDDVRELFGIKVLSPQNILNTDYDFLVIAATGEIIESILIDLQKMGIPENKIVVADDIPNYLEYFGKQLIKKINAQPQALLQKLNNLDQKINIILKCFERAHENDTYIYNVSINGLPFSFKDGFYSNTVPVVVQELNNDCYGCKNIEFNEGDIIIDIGGNVGMVSIYLAKIYPFLKIYAFEPLRSNYENFMQNIKLNDIPEGIITLENYAVTKDGRIVNMQTIHSNSGGSFVADISNPIEKFLAGYQINNAKILSITLEEMFHKYEINKVKMLKIDCEGSEYEILYNASSELLGKIESLRGEFHEDKRFCACGGG